MVKIFQANSRQENPSIFFITATAPGGSLESSSAGLINLPGSIPSQASVPGTTSCPINACRNGGSCYKITTGFTCNCPTGFHGTDCGSMPVMICWSSLISFFY